jgi:hypothetical protein
VAELAGKGGAPAGDQVERFEPKGYVVVLGIGLEDDDVKRERDVPGTLGHRPCGDPADAWRQRRHATEVLRSLQKLKVTVQTPRGPVDRDGTSTQFTPASLEVVEDAARTARGLLFLSHYDPERGLQLGQRMVAMPTLLEAIGPKYQGVVDLAVCVTTPCAPRARAACPDARWTMLSNEIRVDVRASILRATLRSLAANPRPYRQALTDVLVAMSLEAKKRKS